MKKLLEVPEMIVYCYKDATVRCIIREDKEDYCSYDERDVEILDYVDYSEYNKYSENV